jgi:hypothetical protein
MELRYVDNGSSYAGAASVARMREASVIFWSGFGHLLVGAVRSWVLSVRRGG